MQRDICVGLHRHLYLCIENRQRYAYLVRGIGNEALLRERTVGNALQILAKRAGNRLQLVLQVAGAGRREAGGGMR